MQVDAEEKRDHAGGRHDESVDDNAQDDHTGPRELRCG